MKTKVFIPILLVVFLLLTGCTKLTVENKKQPPEEVAINNVAEQAVINQEPVQTNEPQKKVESKIETDESGRTIEKGSNLSVPSNWPADVYVVEGNIIMIETAKKGRSLGIETNQSVESVVNLYKEKLAKDGWTVSENDKMMTIESEKGTLLYYSKGKRSVGLAVAKDSDSEKVQLNISYADLSDFNF